MPTVTAWNGFNYSSYYVPPKVETRAQAAEVEVKRAAVPFELVDEIERTVRLASRTLGLDPAPRVRWLPADTLNIRGVMFEDMPREVWVTVQDREAAKFTALHEVRHVWQFTGDRWKTLGLLTEEQQQADADEFAATWRWDMTPVAAPVASPPRKAQPAHQPYGGRETWQHKGVTYVECDRCDQGVPVNTTHHCRPTYSTKAIDALTASLGRTQPASPYERRSFGGQKYAGLGYSVKAL